MTEPHAAARVMTQRREMGRLMPRAFTKTCWWRFSRSRRQDYIRRLGATPNEQQGLLICALIECEWNKLRCEHEARNATGLAEAWEPMRLAAEFGRQLLLFDRDLARATPRPASPVERVPSLVEVLAERRAWA